MMWRERHVITREVPVLGFNWPMRSKKIPTTANACQPHSQHRSIAMLARLLLVLIYFIFVIVTTRIIEISVSWLEAGCLASQLLDPFSLSVRKLKSILEHRGVSYHGAVEKRELAELVEVSGSVTATEQCSLRCQSGAEDAEEGDELTFTGKSHFFEAVEDTKAGSWLVEVIPSGRPPLLQRTQWKALKKRVDRFGIRFGTLKCEDNPALCSKYNWKKPSLVLSVPLGDQPKGNVILEHYNSKASVDHVVEWVNTKLSSKIVSMGSLEDYGASFSSQQNGISVVLFSAKLPSPPLYLSSLSVHFAGRVRFGHVRLPHWQMDKQHLKNFNVQVDQLPSLMIISPEGSFQYGVRMGEDISYSSLNLLLKTLHPEVNDVFVAVLTVVNLGCVLELFLVQGGALKRLFRFFCLIAFCNTSLIVLCLPVVGLFQLSLFEPVLQLGLQLCRHVTTSSLASILRRDFLFCMEHKCLVLLGYAGFGLIISWITHKYKCYSGTVNEDPDNRPDDWITQDLNYFQHAFQTFPSLWRPQTEYSGLEDGIEWLVRRLAIPDLWLYPIVPTDYIRCLPTWKFATKRGCRQNIQKTGHATVGQVCCENSHVPEGMVACHECSICLEVFGADCILLGLPCGHSFHRNCIEAWLYGGSTSSHHCCPVCRWPAYKLKPKVENLHVCT